MLKRLRPYFRYIRPVRWHFFGALLAGLVFGAATGAGFPLLTQHILPWLTDPDLDVTLTELVLAAMILPAAFLVRGVAGFLNTYGMAYCGQRVLEALRIDIFSHLQKLSLSFFEQRRSGDLVSRMVSDSEVMRSGIVNVSNDLIKQPFTLLGAIAAIVWMSFRVSEFFYVLIFMLSVPVLVFPIRAIAKKLKNRAKDLQAQVGDVAAYITDNMQAPREIRAFNLEEQQVDGLRHRIARLLKWQMKIVKYEKLVAPLVEIVATVGIAATIVYSVRAGVGMEQLGALVVALFVCYEPVKRLGGLHARFKRMEASLDRIEELLHEEPGVKDPPEPEEMGAVKGEVRFDCVSFAYEDAPVLKEVELRVSPGEVVGIVGRSGAGKTTFINLLLRFYDVSAGAVRIDGHDVREVGQADLRRQIAFVPQEPLLFNATAKENILVGRSGATDEEIHEAARQARAHDFISAMENGYETMLGEKGTRLSGGQRQRIALTRAFLRGSPILVLDEATSALDSENETLVQDALKKLIVGKTVFIIAHRFSTLNFVNRILVLHEGELVGDGTHEQLQESCKRYRDLRELQMFE